MKSKDRIIIQKIIGYIDDVEKYVEGLDARNFFDDKKTITACAFTVSQIGELVKEISDETINQYNNTPRVICPIGKKYSPRAKKIE